MSAIFFKVWYCTVAKRRQEVRARVAREQAVLQQHIIQQQWNQQQQQQQVPSQQQQQQQLPGGFSSNFQTVPLGFDASNYSSIYWNQQSEPANTGSSGFRSNSDLPPSYSSVAVAPPAYSVNDKY